MDPFYYFRLAVNLNKKYHEELVAFQARFRGSMNSLSIISLRCNCPQMGIGSIQNRVQRPDFDIQELLKELESICSEGPGRPTPEKKLQSYLLRNAMKEGFFSFDSNLVLITDEFAHVADTKIVADIFAFNMVTDTFVIIELKSNRALTELTNQLNTTESGIRNNETFFKDFLAVHHVGWDETYPIEKIAVWPKGSSDAKRFPAAIREFVYEELADCGYRITEVV